MVVKQALFRARLTLRSGSRQRCFLIVSHQYGQAGVATLWFPAGYLLVYFNPYFLCLQPAGRLLVVAYKHFLRSGLIGGVALAAAGRAGVVVETRRRTCGSPSAHGRFRAAAHTPPAR